MKTMRQSPGLAAIIIFLIGLLLLATGQGRSAPDGDAPGTNAAPVADGSMFARELHAAGALKFYESTEDLLRTGQFERALLRYAFLKGQIARQPGYRPLVTMVNQRLHFLQGQLRLPAQELAALKAPRIRWQPPEKKEAAPANSSASSTSKAQPDPDGQKGDVTPAGEAKSDPAGSPPRQALAAAPQPPASQEKPEDPKAEAEKPPPPPSSRWQRIKQRLLFWRK